MNILKCIFTSIIVNLAFLLAALFIGSGMTFLLFLVFPPLKILGFIIIPYYVYYLSSPIEFYKALREDTKKERMKIKDIFDLEVPQDRWS